MKKAQPMGGLWDRLKNNPPPAPATPVTPAAKLPHQYRAGDDRWDRVLSAIALGGATGLGLAGIAGIIREVGLQKAHDKAMRNPEESDDNTIILTVPQRKAAALKRAMEKCGAVIDELGRSAAAIAEKNRNAASSYNTHVLAKASVPLSALAAYIIADKLHSADIKRRLKQEESEARSEFIDGLSAKQAEDMHWVVYGDDAGLVKEGSNNQLQKFWNWLGGTAGALTLLGAGGTAYITKRLLDAKDDARSSEGWDPPRIKRVVIRSAPLAVDTEKEKVASASDIDSVRAALLVTMSALSGKSIGVLDSKEAKQAMAEAGTSKAELYAMAEKRGQDEGGQIADVLMSNAVLRKSILEQGANAFPGLNRFTYGDEPIFKSLMNAMPRQAVDRLARGPVAAAAQKFYDSQPWHARFRMRRAMKDPKRFNKVLINNPALMDKFKGHIASQPTPAARNPIDLKSIAMKALPLMIGAGVAGWMPKGKRWLPMALGAAGTGYLTRKQWMPVVDSAKSKIKEYASPGATLAKGSKKEGRMLPSVSGIASSFIGSSVADKGGEGHQERGAEVADKQIAMLPTSSLNSLASRIRVEADPGDEEAQAFLDRRRAKINAVLKQLLAEGELRAI